MARSVLIEDMNFCMVCGRPAEWHHVFGNVANRNLSDKYGFIVPLCPEHHRTGKNAAHRCREFDLKLKRMAQSYFEEHCGTREEFIKTFGRSYL